MDLLSEFRRVTNELRMCTAAHFLLVSLLFSVLTQSVTSFPVSKPSKYSICLSRCLLISRKLSDNDLNSCFETCGGSSSSGGDSENHDDVPRPVDRRVDEAESSELGVFTRKNNRLKTLMDILDEMEPTPPCEPEAWDLKYEKRTEYKKFMVPSSKSKRRWGNTIGPCITAHCGGLDGASRLDCIVNMCNRSRRGSS